MSSVRAKSRGDTPATSEEPPLVAVVNNDCMLLIMLTWRLIVIGEPSAIGVGHFEVNSWVPSEGPPQWNLL
ncbi:hypothetical protein KY290_000536 [Solanum tuberosum]|uniref:Uncharacterized protein n=1 Tax=Solanum tuberosum TaxID=4113 RepID=A0ABQ7WJL8_SOLTU|nr:hypothetical protein KY289_000592 [Solanum tuberosum]KAH0780938.1 hypothetical protein KY290_000536 [Solanum tuberosum]